MTVVPVPVPAAQRPAPTARKPVRAGKRARTQPPAAEAVEEAIAYEIERDEQRRTQFVGAFLTRAEKATIDRRRLAYGMRQSDYIRTLLLSGVKEPPPPRTDPEAVRKLAFELSKVGTNLNQLAKRANEAAKIGGAAELDALKGMELRFRTLTAQIAQTFEHVMRL